MSINIEDLPLHMQKQAKEKLLNQEKQSKYHASRMTVDGHTFDSKAEGEHYAALKLLERAGVIRNLKLQPRFELQGSFIYQGHKERKIEYVADFQYEQNGQVVVEDVKGMKTEVYKLKRKLFLYKYGEEITFKEVLNEKD